MTDEAHGIPPLQARIVQQITDIDASAWNGLVGSDQPFLRHEFLAALESQGCLGEESGWLPRPVIFESCKGGELYAAVPQYLKFNSFGEFVFDWAWANAYQRTGLNYYPKLVVASPFTPATGPRVLLGEQNLSLYDAVVSATIDLADRSGVSSLHWLFSTDRDPEPEGLLLRRLGCQFHWQNQDYRDFDDYLERLTSKRRKQIKRERRDVRAAGIHMRRLWGNQATLEDWKYFHRLYQITFAKHGNYPALSLGFFIELGRTLGDQVLLIQALKGNEIIASAFFLVGGKTLFGRYWGASEEIPGLHFETCYYQGLEFCIENGLQRFEPGAQGEHKISRGFLPTRTWSMHWIREPRFRTAIAQFLHQETEHVSRYMDDLNRHSPFKDAVTPHAESSEPSR